MLLLWSASLLIRHRRELEKMKEKHLVKKNATLQLLVIEIYTAKNILSPELLTDVFFENFTRVPLAQYQIAIGALYTTSRAE